MFAKRFKCFYCGRRSAHSDSDTARKWRCKHCEAVNYLDEVSPVFCVFRRQARFQVLIASAVALHRKEKSRILPLQKQIQTSTVLGHQARHSNPPTLQPPAYSAPNVFGTNTSSPALWRPTFHRPMIRTTAHMRRSTPNFARTWRSVIRRCASNANPE